MKTTDIVFGLAEKKVPVDPLEKLEAALRGAHNPKNQAQAILELIRAELDKRLSG